MAYSAPQNTSRQKAGKASPTMAAEKWGLPSSRANMPHSMNRAGTAQEVSPSYTDSTCQFPDPAATLCWPLWASRSIMAHSTVNTRKKPGQPKLRSPLAIISSPAQSRSSSRRDR